MAKILEVKRFSVKIDGKKYGPNEELGPIIENIDDKIADYLIKNSSGSIIEPIKSNTKTNTEKEKKEKAYTDEEITNIRAKGKELGIKNAHNMGVQKLLVKIEEVEAGENDNTETPSLPPLEN